MIIGPFLLQMRSRTGYTFGWVFSGTIVQLVSGVILVGLAEMRLAGDPDMALDHNQIAVKLGFALVAFVAALTGFRRTIKGVPAGSERTLMPFFHTAGGLAIADLFVAVLWPGAVMSWVARLV